MRVTIGGVRIVQLANFYGPRSGGLRTALHHLGEGYVAAGHEVVLIVPGPRRGEELLPTGVMRITLPALAIPGTGGYRAADPRRVADVLGGLRPDVLEVSDRLTLRGFGRWSRRRDVASVMISHERLDRLLGQIMPRALARRCADVANRRTADQYDRVVCTTDFARAEFERIGAPNVELVPLGVDLELFSPRRADRGLRADLGVPGHPLLVHCGRLSVEKRVDRSIEAVAELRQSGVEARLVVAGDGPRRDALHRRARALPPLPGGLPAVHFTGFIADRSMVAKLLATADVSLAPGPHETFGLAALEALAAGTPVVASRSSALADIVTADCGAVADDDPSAFADAVTEVLALPPAGRRAAARRRAEQFTWPAAVAGMLAVLGG
ncbi:GDP-mannose-dependent alpha-(1-6)-phosphatidylinositol dimannoside mannosyltransferase [Nocardia cyriacigeorgica]|uniref:Putative glycosyltransferase n=1 Tax=Nocardia cyriacigeorgica (strain GUH-2) TaxID=1127134 RepID=H6R0I6_NOCCG|nr:GDP-mannose-dependent alpha-(1-6)-phosphatidylinositol dimannoside mannosyltransferase [Nocardia cyriacigeorgica]CCF65455.1 putative glycosyltransferase [Nocardia cyriacigeorgica GUH-2]